MKQILQNLRDGDTYIETVPAPLVRPNHVLVRTERTLISSGTERMLVDFGQASLLAKARQQPDKVRMVFDKIRTDGLLPTLAAVRSKLDQPLAMGYCNVGRVTQIGAGVTGVAVGDRVASNGKHAEIVCVPQNLCAKVPDTVASESAAFTVVSAIALQGIRLVAPSLGETIVVTGLGLIGLITIQLLRAHGCRVLGIDVDRDKIAMARAFGAEVVDIGGGVDPVAAAVEYSRGRGVDGVIITASTKSNEPVHQAALMCRKRGRIVLVGVVGLELSRADFYEKELTFQVSCSYGPGRYDPAYEERGQDYPLGFVRWTQQRNFEAVLDMMADGRLRLDRLISHRFAIERATQAYALLAQRQPSLGIILEYGGADDAAARVTRVAVATPCATAATPTVGFIGSGHYGSQVLIPAFKRAQARLKLVTSAMGVSAVHAARRHAVEDAGTDAAEVLGDPSVDTVVIASRHDTHARYVIEALQAGKHVFVEKPLCLRLAELTAIRAAYEEAHKQGAGPALMVGFNRRFAPHVLQISSLLSGVNAAKSFVMTVNAGSIPQEHWTQDRHVGGGRILGEACHFIDLLRHLAASPVVGFDVRTLRGKQSRIDDVATITLEFASGSVGTVHYLANGHKSFPKERLEIFCAGRILQLDNFRSLRAFGWTSVSRQSLWRQDKGQNACVEAFVRAVRQGAASPIPFGELAEVAELTISIDTAVRP